MSNIVVNSIGGGGGSSGSGSAKTDNAIVLMPWHSTNFGALATVESNEVLFVFKLRNIGLTGRVTRVEIDPRYIYVCEPGSLTVIGAPNPNRPKALSARVEGSSVYIEMEWPWWRRSGAGLGKGDPTEASLELVGVRRTFGGWDMPEKTEEDYRLNEERLSLAPNLPLKKTDAPGW